MVSGIARFSSDLRDRQLMDAGSCNAVQVLWTLAHTIGRNELNAYSKMS